MVKEKRYVLWYSRLTRAADGSWSLDSDLHNLLHGTDLEICGVYDVDEPQKHYDIDTDGILFNASCLKSDDDVTRWNCSDIYYTDISSFTEEAPNEPKRVTMGNERLVGTYQDVQIAPYGEAMAFLFIPYEDDPNVRLYLGHLRFLEARDVFKELIGREPPLPPSGVTFAGSSHSLILTTDDCGRVTLQSLNIKASENLDVASTASGVPSQQLPVLSSEGPSTFFKDGSVREFYPLTEGNWDKLLVSSTSFVDSSIWQIVDTKQAAEPTVVSSSTRSGAEFGLTHSMVSEIWYEGADNARVHAFIVKPSDFDPAKKYPWVMMPHGGPVSSWSDAWSTRVSELPMSWL